MNGFFKGMITGLAVGAAAGMILSPASKNTMRTVKRGADKAVRTVSDFVEDMGTNMTSD